MIDDRTAEAIVRALRESPSKCAELRHKAMSALSSLPEYCWCGVYRLEGDLLVLDEFVGEPTDHTTIPVGRGACGTAVSENRNQVIEDVNALSNYLSCSIKTKSEVVVLVRDPKGGILGQIDIDGHKVGAFDDSDEVFLGRVAEILAARW